MAATTYQMPSLSSPALSRPYLIQSAVGLCVMMSLHLVGPDHQCLLNIHAGGYSDPQKDSIRKIGVCIITVETYVERPTKTIEKLDVHGDASKTKAVALHPKWNLVVNDLQRQTQKLVGVLHSADSDSTPEKRSQAFLRSPACCDLQPAAYDRETKLAVHNTTIHAPLDCTEPYGKIILVTSFGSFLVII